LKYLFKKICIASDHAGFNIKESIKHFLINKNISIIDLGPINKNSVDYPDYAKKVSNRIKSKKSEVGILVCGSGTGMAISANKIKGIRAAVCYNSKSTTLSRKHNDANIISVGSRLTKKRVIIRLISMFLKTKFDGGRHLRRIKKI
jgi:ribose 5-phosphate isomerase B